ncbi:MAG: multidrug transporter permease [Gaiellaceae bacterium]|nr:multidrug transporter permease [Gaiellaceae bacterium]
METDVDRATLAAFVTGSVLAGGNGVAIRFSNRELDPFWGAGLRFVLSALLMFGLVALLRMTLPRGRALAGAVVFGLLQFAAAYALAYYALVELHAGFGQILLALVPLMTLFLAVGQRQERFHVAALGGALLALAGIVVMSSAAFEGSLPLLSVLAAIASALCFAEAAVLVRRLPPVHPVAMSAVGMTTGGVALVLAALVAGETLELPNRSATWSAVLYIATFGSVGVFLLYLFVLGRWVASRAAYSFVLIPIVTVVLSAWLDDEPLGVGLLLGGALVLAGVYVGALRSSTESASAQ